jgi:branched-chain amino acid transport system ATP-binding protein
MKPSLLVHDLHQRYGGVHALKGISFEVLTGECVALIGPNGAGKSTCFACLAGQQNAIQGQVTWRQKTLMNLPAEGRRAIGIARTFQVAQVFEALSVFQNLQLALKASSGLSMLDSLDRCEVDAAWYWLEKMGLNHLSEQALHEPAMHLSYGAKKRLELALAMAGLKEPSAGLLLLDEPAAGLSPEERTDMMQRVKALAKQGTTVLYTEHNMDAVFGVADRVLVLMEGQLVAQGLPHEVAANPLVRDRYLGTSLDSLGFAGHA